MATLSGDQEGAPDDGDEAKQVDNQPRDDDDDEVKVWYVNVSDAFACRRRVLCDVLQRMHPAAH